MQSSHIKTQYLQHGRDTEHKYFTDVNSATRSINIWCYFATFSLSGMHVVHSFKEPACPLNQSI